MGLGPPAGGGDNSDVAFDQPRDEPPFAVAEVTLTVTANFSAAG